jgi:queuine tRNA-ribosyltransferase
MLGPILLSIHNLTYYQRLMREIRQAIAGHCFLEFCQRKQLGWSGAPAT